MPHGRRVGVFIEMPEDTEEKAREIRAAGFNFEIEMLSTGEISMEIFRHKDETSLAAEICQNGPAVRVAVAKMVEDGFRELKSNQL